MQDSNNSRLKLNGYWLFLGDPSQPPSPTNPLQVYASALLQQNGLLLMTTRVTTGDSWPYDIWVKYTKT